MTTHRMMMMIVTMITVHISKSTFLLNSDFHACKGDSLSTHSDASTLKLRNLFKDRFPDPLSFILKLALMSPGKNAGEGGLIEVRL